MTDHIEQLLAFGQMGLETGYYEQARDYFEQVLELDPSNREALKGLAEAKDMLSRRKDAAAEPSWAELVEPQRTAAPVRSVPETRPEWQQRAPVPEFMEESRFDERGNSMEFEANDNLEWLGLQLKNVSIRTWIVVWVKMGVALIIVVAVLALIAFVLSLVLARIDISIPEVLSDFL